MKLEGIFPFLDNVDRSVLCSVNYSILGFISISMMSSGLFWKKMIGI